MEIPIEGQRHYAHTAMQIYDIIIDLPELIMEFPIIEKVTSPQPDTFEVTIQLDVKLYSGQYKLEVVIVDKSPHQSLQLRGYHKSRVGKLGIDVKAQIIPISEVTNRLDISGIFSVNGMMKYAGRKTLTNGVDMGIRLMFDYLGQKLNDSKEKPGNV